MLEDTGAGDQVAQPERKHKSSGSVKKRKEKSPIQWNEWWPFTRATGDALKQLNRRQPKKPMMDDYEQAPY